MPRSIDAIPSCAKRDKKKEWSETTNRLVARPCEEETPPKNLSSRPSPLSPSFSFSPLGEGGAPLFDFWKPSLERRSNELGESASGRVVRGTRKASKAASLSFCLWRGRRSSNRAAEQKQLGGRKTAKEKKWLTFRISEIRRAR